MNLETDATAAGSGDHPHAVVVGAGVMGASTAWALARRDWRVTLVDTHEPGHVRASSGDESRLIRCGHGPDRHYTRWADRAWDGWRALEAETGQDLLVHSGLCWFARRPDGWEAATAATFDDLGIGYDKLAPDEATGLFPSLYTGDLAFVLRERRAGVLRARRAVRALADATVARGGALVRGQGRPVEGGAVVEVDGRRLTGDAVVWALGPWLPKVFGDVTAPLELQVTKQDVTYFGAPPAWATPPVPGWGDYDGAAYGLGDLAGHGVKCATDHEGAPFDPDTGERMVSPDSLERSRSYLAHRFPALANAPLVAGHTCQYTLTPDTEFLIAPHPDTHRTWLVGGGSGHGFKHGPVLGDHVADLVTGRDQPLERMALRARAAGMSLRTAGGRSPVV